MATRSRATFKKRQKEMARAEKQREKAAKRLQRKDEEHGPVVVLTLEEAELLRTQSYLDTPEPGDAEETSGPTRETEN